MPTFDSTNLDAAISGVAYTAPAGTTLPTDPTASFPAGFSSLGYLDATGIEEDSTITTNDTYGWPGNVLLRRLVSKAETTFKFTMLETKASTLLLYYKNSTITSASGFFALAVKTPGSDIRPFAFDVIDGTEHQRIVVPLAEVSARGVVSYKADGVTSFGVTLTAYPDATETVAYKYSTNASWGES